MTIINPFESHDRPEKTAYDYQFFSNDYEESLQAAGWYWYEMGYDVETDCYYVPLVEEDYEREVNLKYAGLWEN